MPENDPSVWQRMADAKQAAEAAQKAKERLAFAKSDAGIGRTFSDRARLARAERHVAETAKDAMDAQRVVEILRGEYLHLLPQILRELTLNVHSAELPASGYWTAMMDGKEAYWGDAGVGGQWNGTVRDFYGFAMLTVDVSTKALQAENVHGEFLCYNAGTFVEPVVGGTAAIGGSQPRFWWTRSVPGAPWQAWQVAESYRDAAGALKYRLAKNSGASGDIRLSLPITHGTAKYAVVQQGGGAVGDNGPLATYPRVHG